MYLPLILAAIVLSSAIYLLLQYSSRTLAIDNDEASAVIDDISAHEAAKAA